MSEPANHKADLGNADSAGAMPARGRVLAALLLLFTVACIVALVEGTLQFLAFRDARLDHESWASQAGPFRVHPFLQVAPRPSRVLEVNEHGFRGPPIDVARRSGSLRIFVLGGSTSFSSTLAFADTYPAQLAVRLQERSPGLQVEVQNAASDWYSTQHSIIRYQFAVRRFAPDVVLVFHAINDLYRGFAPEWWSVGDVKADYSHFLGPLVRVERGRGIEQSSFPFTRFLLWDRLKQGLTGGGGADVWDPRALRPSDRSALSQLREHTEPRPVHVFPSLPEFRENLATLAALVARDGATLVIGTQPSLYAANLSDAERALLFFAPLFVAGRGGYADLESMRRGMQIYNDAALDVAREAGVEWVDLASAVPRSGDYFRDDVHMTPAGLAIAAEHFADAIEDAGLLGGESAVQLAR